MKIKLFGKRIFMLFVIIALMISSSSCSASSYKDGVSVIMQIGNPIMTVSNTEKEIDPGRGSVPIIEAGRALVPVRAVTESMGAVVSWNPSDSTVTINAKGKNMVFTIGSYDVYVNGKKTSTDSAPKIINGRTMMPIRFISEQLSYTVSWDADNKIIVITDGDVYADTSFFKHLLTVHYIDVGQGDSEFVEFPGGEVMLIDAGPRGNGATEYIKKLGYEKINYVIATHPDADHIGSMAEILKNFNVDKFFMPNKSHTTKTFENMLDALEENGCECIYAAAGEDIINDGRIHAQILAPCKTYDDSNDMSAVIKIRYNNISFLFTGDITSKSEKDIVESGADLRADIIKIAHHGSSGSSSQLFLNAVSPKTAVISVGKDNKYGHPTTEVLDRLKMMNISVYRTDISGSIRIKSDGMTYYADVNPAA